MQASQGDIDQALLLVHKHADLLLQPGFNDNSPSGQAQSSPAPQELSHARNLPVTAHRHQTTSAISKALDVGHLPTPVKPLLPAGVSLPIPLQISPPAVNNREHLSAFSRHGSAALQATEMGQLPTTVKQLLPAGVSLPTPLLSSPPAVNSKEHLSALSKRGSGVLHAAEVGTAEADRKLTYSSMGSDDSNNEAQEQSLQWLSGHDAVPESVDAALAAASKVLQERGRIRDAADQERQTLTLHTQARDVYFEAAQRAYERGMLHAAIAGTVERVHCGLVCLEGSGGRCLA